MADLIGQTFGNYRLTALLGSGGFAEVYLGEHTRLGMQAAVKILHAHLAGEEAAHFQEEARTIAELIHPHIIRVLDFDVQENTPFLVLDYAPNGSLRQRHKKGEQVPPGLVASYVTQVAEALQYAHDRKRIHRDVKPENMLVGRQGEILLSDFGISSVAHSTSSMRTEAPLGTLAYMAPEQIEGHARPASDQYALAVTVYQWLCGSMPFHGSSAEIIGQQLGRMPPPLHSLLPDIPRAVEDVVMTALAKEPRERFPSVQAFATAFARAAEGQGNKTFSYTATTVVEPERGSPAAITPPFSAPTSLPAQATIPPWQAANAPTVQDTAPQEARTPSPRAAGTYTQTEPYLRPGMPYIPPEEPRPRIGWAVFWRGVVLAVGLGILFFLLPLSYFLSPVGTLIFGCVFFMGGWWGAQKTGLLHAGLFVAFWGAFWAVCLFAVSVLWKNVMHNFAMTASDFTESMPLIVVSIGLSTCGAALGGLIGRRIYRARQPIHPPAGGAGLV
jgi:serine/threonine protein kinase